MYAIDKFGQTHIFMSPKKMSTSPSSAGKPASFWILDSSLLFWAYYTLIFSFFFQYKKATFVCLFLYLAGFCHVNMIVPDTGKIPFVSSLVHIISSGFHKNLFALHCSSVVQHV